MGDRFGRGGALRLGHHDGQMERNRSRILTKMGWSNALRGRVERFIDEFEGRVVNAKKLEPR